MRMLLAFCGKIASGKSTLAAALATSPRTVLVSEDQLLSHLYPGEIAGLDDYARSAKRLRAAIGPHLEKLLETGLTVVLDFQANTPSARHWIRAICQRAGTKCQLHYVQASDDLCKARLSSRNRMGGHEYQVSESEFELFTSYFVPPTADEGFDIVVHEQR